MIILEDDLEKLMVSNEPTELTYEGYQQINERLNQLHPHMQASSGCWEDTVNQVGHMLRRANAASGGGRSMANKQCVAMKICFDSNSIVHKHETTGYK